MDSSLSKIGQLFELVSLKLPTKSSTLFIFTIVVSSDIWHSHLEHVFSKLKFSISSGYLDSVKNTTIDYFSC